MLLSMFTEVILLSSAVFFFAICHSHWDEMDDYVRNVCGFRGKEVAKFRLPIWNLSIFTHSKVKMMTAAITAGLYALVAIYLAGVFIADFINTGAGTALLSLQINLIVFSVVVAVGAFYFSLEFWLSNITEAFRIEISKCHVTRADLLVKFNAKYAKVFKQHLVVLILVLVVLAKA